jgi:serine protease Do
VAKKTDMNRASKICWAILGLLALSFSNPVPFARASQNLLDSLNSETARIVREVRPSLVAVESYSQQSSPTSIHAAVATGILYTRDGYVITTGTLAQSNRIYRVRDHQGRDYPGRLIGTDYETNLAVIKIESTDLFPAKFGDSRNVKAGSWVVVLADGYGLPNSVSLGLFNGRRSADGTMQLSISLSPAASGAAVVNSGGEVIAILTAKGSEIVTFDPRSWIPVQLHEKLGKGLQASSPENPATSAAEDLPPTGRLRLSLPTSGVGLALPIELVEDIAEDLIEFGEVRRGFLGISQINLTPEIMKRYEVQQGVVVTKVAEGSPAERSGLRNGDVIVHFDGKPVDGTQGLFTMVRSIKPGKKVKLEIVRQGIPQTVEAELGQIPEAYRPQTANLNLTPAVA